MGTEHAARARALLGTRFRPQGRTSDGLDCVGLVLATYKIPHDGVRPDYALRGDHRREAGRALDVHFRRVPKKDARPGDVMLLSVTDDQLHLAVRTEAGFVHAHAGLRRVVETPGEPDWPVLGIYRKRIRNRSS